MLNTCWVNIYATFLPRPAVTLLSSEGGMAIVFAITSLLLPPQGVIDSSVLVLVAQLLLLCATFLGVESYVNIIKQLKP